MQRPRLNDPGRSEEGSVFDYRMVRRYTGSHSVSSDEDHNHNRSVLSSLGQVQEDSPYSPPLLSSPSQVSSIDPFSAAVSPLRRDLSRTTLHEEPDHVSSSSRLALARRLSHLAQQLTCDDDVDEQALTSQVDYMEKFVSQNPSSKGPGYQSRPKYIGIRSQSDPGGVFDCPVALRGVGIQKYSIVRDHQTREIKPADEPRKGLSQRQVNKIVAEATKLNEELSVVVSNLQARQEESDVCSNQSPFVVFN